MPAPQPTDEQVQAIRDRYALLQAQAWGYDPHDQRRRRECANLAWALDDIQQRRGRPRRIRRVPRGAAA
jgi:hypothetical protein